MSDIEVEASFSLYRVTQSCATYDERASLYMHNDCISSPSNLAVYNSQKTHLRNFSGQKSCARMRVTQWVLLFITVNNAHSFHDCAHIIVI